MNKTDYKNPFILERADPYIVKGKDEYYYFTATYPMKSDDDKEGYDRVILRRAETICLSIMRVVRRAMRGRADIHKTIPYMIHVVMRESERCYGVRMVGWQLRDE